MLCSIIIYNDSQSTTIVAMVFSVNPPSKLCLIILERGLPEF
jgi:hypothetical protein